MFSELLFSFLFDSPNDSFNNEFLQTPSLRDANLW